MDTLEEELLFLIVRYLESGPCLDATKVLKKEIERRGLLPKRIDWEGRKFPRAYEELVATHPHISNDYLKRICMRLPSLLDEKFPPSVKGVQSLLGAGSQSLLRSEKTLGKKLRPSDYLHTRNSSYPLLPNNLLHPLNTLRATRSVEYTGIRRPAEQCPKQIFGNYQLQRRFVGHLSAVFCVLYDRTGDFIFTGADDKLVKIWSAITGRLLATLRGHDGEIVDLSVNLDNTLLASGSCDKTVRIWCLQTTVCMCVLHGHTSTITSVQFCPLIRGPGRYLISTGEDATVCFWYYTPADKTFETKPIKFIERSKSGAKMLCSSFSPGGLFLATGNTDSVIRVYCLLGQNPEKIGELEAHTDMVDSIQYSHHSDRFISGSKDGTARIWRHMRNEWLNLVLTMKSEASELSNMATDQTSTNLRVNMVAWTADDVNVVTAVSDFSIRIWCSKSGKPVRTLKGHEDDVFVLDCASFNRNLLVTAGHDGRIKVWDMSTGSTLMDYYNMIDGQGFGAAYDCRWSPHHHSFSATDSHGHLMRFGVGRNDKFNESRIPTELFFHTDYRGLIRDANDHVLDELTQRAVHLLPPPFLVDIEGLPYPPKFQRLVPGRESLSEDNLVPLLAEMPNGEREIIDQEVPATNRQNPAISASAPQATQSSSSVAQVDGSQTLPPTEVICPPLRRTIVREMCPKLLHVLQQHSILITELEQNNYISEVKKRPFREDELPSGLPCEPVYLRTRRNQQKYRTRTARRQQERQQGEQAVRNRLTTRALYDTDYEEDDENEVVELSSSHVSEASSSSADEEEEIQPSRPRRRAMQTDTLSDDGTYSESTRDDSGSSEYSDWEPDNKANLQPPSRRSSRKITSTRVYSPDSEKQSSNSIKTSKVVANGNSNKTDRARRRAKRLAAEFESSIAEASSENDMLDIIRPPEWLTTDRPRKSPYFPQMGDELIYFFQGHMIYVEEVQKQQLYETAKNLPWEKLTNLREQELVRVMGIKYEVKPKSFIRLCCLKLGRIYPDSKVFTGTGFNVKYHDMAGVIDFLVLRQSYDISQQRNWQVGNRFRSVIDDKWWSGVIKEHRPLDSQYPDSQFLSLQVEWDDGSCDTLSPWDLEPLPAHIKVPLRGADMTEREQISLLYTPDVNEWPECGRDSECSRIASCFEQLMGYSVSEAFNAPVDLNQFQSYALEIAYPIDLSTIKSRLENGFYRRVAAIQFDVRHIESNAEQFNQPGSLIVRNARIVTELCLNIISDDSCRDAHAVYRMLDLEDDYYAMVEQTSQNKGKGKKPSLPQFDWKSSALDMLEEAFECDDSLPFRAPVDILQLPGYSDVVHTPMDLSTVKENLECGEYNNLQELISDVKLIFSNSRKYNTNKRSKVYSMTIRLNALMEERMQSLQEKLRKSQKQQIISPTKRSTRSSVKNPLELDVILHLKASTSRKTWNLRTLDRPSSRASSGNKTTHDSDVAAGSSHYATRSTTGRLKPKKFADDILVDTGTKSMRRNRKALESSDEEEDDEKRDVDKEDDSFELPVPNRNKKKPHVLNDSLSDYDKDTDEENGHSTDERSTDEELDDLESEDSEDCDERSEQYNKSTSDTDYNSDTELPRAKEKYKNGLSKNNKNKRKLNSKNNKQDKKKRKISNGESRPSRARKQTAGMYQEWGSDTDVSSDMEEITSTISSRGRVRKLRSGVLRSLR